MPNDRVANPYLVTRRAGVDIAEGLQHFDDMAHAVVQLCQAAGLPLHYRFRLTPHGPVSQQLNTDCQGRAKTVTLGCRRSA